MRGILLVVEPEIVEFSAILTGKGQCIGFYNDGTSRLVLEASAMHMPALIRLAAYGRERPLEVTVTIREPNRSLL
jgi:hypothetical protein